MSGFGDRIFNNEIIAVTPLYFNKLDAAPGKKVAVSGPDTSGKAECKRQRRSMTHKARPGKRASRSFDVSRTSLSKLAQVSQRQRAPREPPGSYAMSGS